MANRMVFDKTLLDKLTVGERSALEDLTDANTQARHDVIEVEISKDGFSGLTSLERRELELLRHKQLQLVQPVSLNLDLSGLQCCICFDKFESSNGLHCLSSARHFQCTNCFTHFVEVLNSQREHQLDLLRGRAGSIRCCAVDCSGSVLPRATVCRNINNPDVLEVCIDV